MRPTGTKVEQVREVLAAKGARAGRHRAELAATARWLRSLRSRAAPAPTRS